MAINESTATAVNQEAAQFTKYDFEPVPLTYPGIDRAKLPGAPVKQLADIVEVVSTGSASILRLIEWDEMREDEHQGDPETMPPPVLNAFHRSALLRLVAVNMEMLSDKAFSLKKWAFEQHTEEGKAQELASAMQLVKHYQDVTNSVRR